MAVLGSVVLDGADWTSSRPPKTSLGVGPQAQRSLGSDKFVCFLTKPVQEFTVAWLCWGKYLEVGSQEINVYQGLVHNCSLDMHNRVLECGQGMLEEFLHRLFQ